MSVTAFLMYRPHYVREQERRGAQPRAAVAQGQRGVGKRGS